MLSKCQIRHLVLKPCSCHLLIGSKIVFWLNLHCSSFYLYSTLVYFLALHLTFLLNAERSVQKLLDNNVVPVAAVVIMACNRPDYLERTVESILKYGSRLNHSFSKGKKISILVFYSWFPKMFPKLELLPT